VRLTLKLMGIGLVGVLAAPALASVVRDLGAEPGRYDVLSTNGPGAAACTASQCGLLDQKSAADALAMAAGAGPATPMNRPSVVPDSWRNGLAGASGGTLSTTGPKQNSDVDPVLFTVIAQSRVAQGQLCMEEGNLLGFAPTCARPRSAADAGFSVDCPSGSGYNRLGRGCSTPDEDTESCTNRPGFNRLGILCGPPGFVPEPGTPLLLAIALLGLVATRVRSTRRKVSPAPL
jgi:hypothetical protein